MTQEEEAEARTQFVFEQTLDQILAKLREDLDPAIRKLAVAPTKLPDQKGLMFGEISVTVAFHDAHILVRKHVGAIGGPARWKIPLGDPGVDFIEDAVYAIKEEARIEFS